MGTQATTDMRAPTLGDCPGPCCALPPWRKAWVLQEGEWELVCLGCHHVPGTVPGLPVVGAPSLSVERANECEK